MPAGIRQTVSLVRLPDYQCLLMVHSRVMLLSRLQQTIICFLHTSFCAGAHECVTFPGA